MAKMIAEIKRRFNFFLKRLGMTKNSKKKTQTLNVRVSNIEFFRLSESSFLFNTSRFTSTLTEVEDTCTTYFTFLVHRNAFDER